MVGLSGHEQLVLPIYSVLFFSNYVHVAGQNLFQGSLLLRILTEFKVGGVDDCLWIGYFSCQFCARLARIEHRGVAGVDNRGVC